MAKRVKAYFSDVLQQIQDRDKNAVDMEEDDDDEASE